MNTLTQLRQDKLKKFKDAAEVIFGGPGSGPNPGGGSGGDEGSVKFPDHGKEIGTTKSGDTIKIGDTVKYDGKDYLAKSGDKETNTVYLANKDGTLASNHNGSALQVNINRLKPV